MILRVTTSLYPIISSIEPEKPDTPEEPEEPNEPDEPLVLPRLLAIQPITESVFQLQYNLPVDIRRRDPLYRVSVMPLV